MIEVRNVSMKFNLAEDNVTNLKEYLIKLVKGQLKYNEFWALNDINFSVEKGDILGIIGRNGSGKSTLLKIIAGVMKPTKGYVTRKGTIAPMLELGAGFDYDLTARENVFLNGAMLSYTEKFLNSKYDEIVRFAGLKDFMDVPIRNFSSGMTVRLAFSINTIVDPEVLIVDEVLSVGDEEFRRKSENKMKDLMSGGTTVIFVSHSMDQIQSLCNKVAWVDKGNLKMFGEPKKVCEEYLKQI